MLYDLFGAETRKLLTLIADGARRWTAADVKDAKAAATKTEPPGFRAHQKAQRLRYVGDQAGLQLAELKRAYPASFDEAGRHPFAINPVRYLAHWAASDAGNYVQPATRVLVTDAGDEVDADDPRAAELAAREEAIGVDVLMPEVERRCIALEQAIVHVGWYRSHAQDVGRLKARLWWPEDVIVMAHPSAPDEDDAIVLLMAKEATPAGEPQRWWVWSRSAVEDERGAVVSFGPWHSVHVDEEGKHSTLPEPYDGALLPFVFARLKQPEGSLWVSEDRDTGAQVDALNRMRANLQLVVDMQGHDERVYSGTMLEGKSLKGGPDKVIKVGPQETLQTLSYNAKITEMQAVQDAFAREIAITRRNNPDVYSSTTGEVASGVSRMIANAPHEQAVRENSHALKRFEEQRLWPVVVEVGDLFGPQDKRIGDGVKVRVTLAGLPVFEDPEAKQRRVQQLLDEDMITRARAAVMLGIFATVAEAKQSMGDDADEYRSKRPPPGLPPPVERPAPVMVDDEDEDPSDDVVDDGGR